MTSVRRTRVEAPPEPEVSLRLLVIVAVATAVGVVGWRFPFTINPMLLVVATFAVLDKVTDRVRH